MSSENQRYKNLLLGILDEHWPDLMIRVQIPSVGDKTFLLKVLMPMISQNLWFEGAAQIDRVRHCALFEELLQVSADARVREEVSSHGLFSVESLEDKQRIMQEYFFIRKSMVPEDYNRCVAVANKIDD